MNDYIFIEDLEIFAYHGVHEEENTLGQKFYLSLKLFFDGTRAGKYDSLSDTVNYSQVCNRVMEYMKENTFNLIERAAYYVAECILRDFEIVESVEVTVKKPWAPIKHPVGCVGFCAKRGWNRVYLSLGSNMGDKKNFLDRAVEMLSKDKGIKNLRCSEYIATKPYGKLDQDDFVNCAVELYTYYEPNELLEVTGSIENELGRVRVERWGPRTIDIDILLYEDKIICDKNLTIPHADMSNRAFVLQPLCELNPYLVHPVLKKNIRQLFDELP